MVTRRRFGYQLRAEVTKIDSTLGVDMTFSEDILETWPVREAFLFFCLAADPDAPTWRAWLGYQNSPPADKYLAPSRNAGAYLKLLTAMGDEITGDKVAQVAACPVSTLSGEGRKWLWERAKRYVELKEEFASVSDSAVALVETVFEAKRWCSESDENRAAVELDMTRLREKALQLLYDPSPLPHPAESELQDVARALRHQIATREPFLSDDEANLHVATLWGAKGATADHVYVLGLCNEALPGERRDDYPGTDEEHSEEQRRLFYVSITRSRRTLVLSRPARIQRGDVAQLGLRKPTSGTRWWADLSISHFLRDIEPFLPDAVDGDRWDGCT